MINFTRAFDDSFRQVQLRNYFHTLALQSAECEKPALSSLLQRFATTRPAHASQSNRLTETRERRDTRSSANLMAAEVEKVHCHALDKTYRIASGKEGKYWSRSQLARERLVPRENGQSDGLRWLLAWRQIRFPSAP